MLRKAGQSKLLQWINVHLSSNLDETSVISAAYDQREPSQRKSNGQEVNVQTAESGSREGSSVPEMTDGESAEESDSGLGALLRDEYLKSLFITSPTTHFNPIGFPSPPTTLPSLPNGQTQTQTQDLITGRKRAQTRNQYTQLLNKFPTPTSPYLSPKLASLNLANSMRGHITSNNQSKVGTTAPLNIRRHVKPLNIIATTTTTAAATAPPPIPPKAPQRQSQTIAFPPSSSPSLCDSRKIVELRIFLTREAGVYHQIAHRLVSSRWAWAEMTDDLRNRVEDELNWLDMTRLLDEIRILRFSESKGLGDEFGRSHGMGTKKKSMVHKGGHGYI
ncbi:hypothetical protein CI109_105832 [Kwoniella shandongensis]|uniref:Uncharacterized protein n=1 Tax=Kwoniella shandongensis TaxID=1734106 RepID=A0A5M6BX54_9TREE|nr:uncharacterized protein CI109_005733 [Kwoniella shandongensis]KAA5525985.1 hypothetical protein CI109_005733 [Kwoniella shandongensis]